MTSQPMRALVLALGVSWAVAACGSPAAKTSPPAAPREVAKACGHPGAVVELTKVPVVVAHASCDLTGVIVRFRGIGVTVPADGGASAQGDGPGGGTSLTVQVAGNGDVTIDD